MPEVSIIIPTYNREKFLSKAIKSILTQTFKDFELIIVDDGSIDNTREIVNGFIKQDRRIRYIYRKNSGGTSVPRNEGIKQANGNYIAFLDSDDQWLPEKLEKQITFFKNSKDKKLGFLGCGALAVKENTESIIAEYKLPNSFRGNVFFKLLKNNFILSPSGIIISKKILDMVGMLDKKFKMVTDWDLYIRILKKYNFDFIKEPLFKYYVHEKNITKTLDRREMIEDAVNLFEKHKNDYSFYFPNLYAENLRYFANFYCKTGFMKLGRKYFVKAIRENWKDYKSYLYFILSFIGSKFYRFCFKVKKIFLSKKTKFQEKDLNDSPEQIFNIIFKLED